MHNIKLPSQVFEYSLFQFIHDLGNANNAEHVVVDFIYVNYYVPGAIVALVTKFHRWLADGKKVSLNNYKECPAYKYLQRIDFFSNCGIILEEEFQRHPSEGRFVPISKIGYNIEKLSTEIATCMEPSLADSDDIEITGPFDYFEYSISELGNNTMQHSNGVGFACAQYTPSSDFIRVAVADTGIGIKNSYIESGSPHYSHGLDDLGAIKLSLKPQVSSKMHLHGWGGSPNMGVGLSLLWDTVHKLKGKFAIVSGDGCLSTDANTIMEASNAFNGTLCTFLFKRGALSNFNSLLSSSKTDLGLTKNQNNLNGLFL